MYVSVMQILLDLQQINKLRAKTDNHVMVCFVLSYVQIGRSASRIISPKSRNSMVFDIQIPLVSHYSIF